MPKPFSRPEAPSGVQGTVEASEGASAAPVAPERGICTIAAEDYHQDPAPTPSLSASIAHLLVNRTPLHAWYAHPRLNPDYEPEEKPHFDLGTVAHELLLEGTDDRVRVIAADSWRTREAQECRDEARACGEIPLLVKDWDRVRAMVGAVRAQLEARHDDPPLFADGKPEQTLIWEEQGVTCRALVDWLRDDLLAIDDLKTTGRTANPVVWSKRTLWDIGADIQVAFNLRGVKALAGKTPVFRYVLVENTPPFALAVVSPAPSALELGQAKADFAIRRWRECLEANEWPGYPAPTYYAEAPAWAETAWMEFEAEVLTG